MGGRHLQSGARRGERLCTLIVIGADENDRKQLLAVEDGVRESKQNWQEVLLHLQERGMGAPNLAMRLSEFTCIG